MPSVAIYGAGAIGLHMAFCLHRAGVEDVWCICRGPHLRALRERGLKITLGGETHHLREGLRYTDDPAEVGPVDYVILTVKTYSMGEVLPCARPTPALAHGL